MVDVRHRYKAMMQSTMYTLAEQARNTLNGFELPILGRLDDPPGSSLKLLIISKNLDANGTIFSLLDEMAGFDTTIHETNNLDNAVRQIRSANHDLAIFVVEGWNIDEQKHLANLLETTSSCPVIVASQNLGVSVAQLQQNPNQIDLRHPTSDTLLTAISHALYTHEIGRQLDKVIEELQTAEAEKSHFLAHMSHDLKTPLNAIIGFSDAISHGIYGEPPTLKDHENIAQINAIGTHLLHKINQLIEDTEYHGDD